MAVLGRIRSDDGRFELLAEKVDAVIDLLCVCHGADLSTKGNAAIIVLRRMKSRGDQSRFMESGRSVAVAAMFSHASGLYNMGTTACMGCSSGLRKRSIS